MALKYVVKKTTFGFDKEKAEKYVAKPFNVVTVDFKMLCDQVTKVGFVPRGTVTVSYTHLNYSQTIFQNYTLY